PDDLVSRQEAHLLGRRARQHAAAADARRPAAPLEVTLVLRVAELRPRRLVDGGHVADLSRIAAAGRLVLRLELLHLQLRRALLDPRRALVCEARLDEALYPPLLDLLGRRLGAPDARPRFLDVRQ